MINAKHTLIESFKKKYKRGVKFHQDYIVNLIRKKLIVKNPSINKKGLSFFGRSLSSYDVIIDLYNVKLGDIVYVIKSSNKKLNFLKINK